MNPVHISHLGAWADEWEIDSEAYGALLDMIFGKDVGDNYREAITHHQEASP